MPELELSVALTDNARTRPILDGCVGADGVRLLTSALNAGEMFWRQLKFGEFDLSEMSISTLAIAASHGRHDWLGLPIFTFRQFFHTGVLVRDGAGIVQPADLRGKRVGVSEFQQTSVVWIRGILEDQFGVDPRELDWVMERSAEKSHGSATGFAPPPGIRLSFVQDERDLGALLLAGEIDALLFAVQGGTLLDRKRTDLSRSPHVRPLFADRRAEARRYYGATGIYPMNHCIVIRRSLAAERPALVPALYDAFLTAKDGLRSELASLLAPSVDVGALERADLEQALRGDPLAYGLRATRPALEMLFGYLQRQGLTARPVTVAELFDERLE